MRVRSITKIPVREDVYDLEVPATHCLAVNGGIIVHNCRYSREADIKASAAKKFVGAPKAMARRFGSGG